MAVIASAANAYLNRTASLPAVTNLTIMSWFVIPTYTTNNPNLNFFNLNTAAPYIYVGTKTSGDPSVKLELFIDDGVTTHDAVDTIDLSGKTVNIAFVKAGNLHTVYLTTKDGAYTVSQRLQFNLADNISSWGEWLHYTSDFTSGTEISASAGIKCWSAALTTTELQAELSTYQALQTSNLYVVSPLATAATATTDISGGAHTWTANGDPLGNYTPGPLIPTNLTAATALDLGTLPGDMILDVQDAPTATGRNEVWFKYTAQPSDFVIGAWAHTPIADAYWPEMTVWTGTPPGVVQYLSLLDSFNQPMQVPVTSGTVYYFRVVSAFNTVPLDSQLSVTTYAAPTVTGRVGDVLIVDADQGFPGAIINLASGALSRFSSFPNAEWGDQLPNGIYAINPKPTITDAVIYSPDGTVVATIPSVLNNSALYEQIRASAPHTFFFGKGAVASAAVISTASDTGAIGGTTWTLPANSFQLKGMAPSTDQSILYYTSLAGGSNAVHRYDLVAHAPLSDLAATLAGYSPIVDLLVLSDDTILVGYQKSNAPKILRYDPTGAVLNTYPFTEATLHQMRLTLDDPSSFLVRNYTANARFQTYYQIRVSDGSVLASATIPIFVGGVWQDNSDTPPTFGSSDTCPFILLAQNVGPLTISSAPVRRMRQFTIPSIENFWLFLQKIELEFQRGQGLVTGQGSDPQIMFQLSRDGGKTWGPERWLSAGKLGEYDKRAIWRKLGRARNPVGRFIVSDPCFWALQDCYFDGIQGSS